MVNMEERKLKDVVSVVSLDAFIGFIGPSAR